MAGCYVPVTIMPRVLFCFGCEQKLLLLWAWTYHLSNKILHNLSDTAEIIINCELGHAGKLSITLFNKLEQKLSILVVDIIETKIAMVSIFTDYNIHYIESLGILNYSNCFIMSGTLNNKVMVNE